MWHLKYTTMIRLLLIQIITILALLTALTSCNNSDSVTDNSTLINASLNKEEQETSLLSRYPLLTWARKTPVEIGCMLEKEFSYRDSVFNCDYKNYVNKGDPCKKTDEYYEGLKFPIEWASKIDRSIKDITFDFEHGNLREITIMFQDSLLKNQIIQKFNLPLARTNFPDNIMDIGYGENIFSKEKPINQNYTKWLTITGFEHMGAGDVDCN